MVRLGATIDDYLESNDPFDLVVECQRKGYRAGTMPLEVLDEPDHVQAIASAFENADILLAEMAAWVNPLHHNDQTRKDNIETIKRRLALADEVGSVCLATVSGSYCELDQWDSHVGHHPDNFTQKAFDGVVSWVREVLDEVKPKRTKLTLEMSPWILIDSPETYLELIQAVDRPGLGAHLDPANLVIGPRIYFETAGMIDRCFNVLGQHICSCHAKDVHWALDARTVAIQEVIPGRGALDYAALIDNVNRHASDVPMIIEHVETEESFDEAARFIKRVGLEVGVSI